MSNCLVMAEDSLKKEVSKDKALPGDGDLAGPPGLLVGRLVVVYKVFEETLLELCRGRLDDGPAGFLADLFHPRDSLPFQPFLPLLDLLLDQLLAGFLDGVRHAFSAQHRFLFRLHLGHASRLD